MTKKDLRKIIFDSARELFGKEVGLDLVEVNYPLNEFGDYSTNVALRLASVAKKDPMEIAREIKKKIEDLEKRKFTRIDVAPPGFLNFFLNDAELQNVVRKIGEEGKKFGNSEIGKGTKVQVEFVSANPTGPIHLGNGRGGPFGDTLVSVFLKAGFETEREYYVNDFGNQVKILGHSVLKDEQAQYKGDYIDRLADELANKEEDPFEIGQKAAEKIVEQIIRPVMERLGIKFDNYFSERSLHEGDAVQKVLDDFQKRELIYEKDDALWFCSTKFGDDKDRVVRKSTGEVTYFGTDIAYHKNKFERGFDKVINVWGADHHGDVARVKGAVEALGYEGKLEIILTQFVRVIKNGKEFKMSKRKGTYVSVSDLLDEVGKDVFRFFFLMHSADTHMDFDIDLAKEKSEKNPAFYVQYAHARISSILKKYESQTDIFGSAVPDLGLLVNEKEFALIRSLNRFPELIEEISKSYEVHKLPYFAMKLADRFHSFYHECKVLDEKQLELSLARLELARATKNVLAQTLELMGVDAPDEM